MNNAVHRRLFDAENFSLITLKEKKFKSLWFHTIWAPALRWLILDMEYYFNFMASINRWVKMAVDTYLKSRYSISVWFRNVRHGHLSAVLITLKSVRLISPPKFESQTCEKVNKISFWNVKLNVSKVIKMNAKVLKSVLSLSKLSNLKLKLN